MSIEAMKLALEALTCTGENDDPGHRCGHCDDYVDRNGLVRAALRTAIADAETQEPVAWIALGYSPDLGEYYDFKCGAFAEETSKDGWTPLYTTPPAAQRQPLTTEQYMQALGVLRDEMVCTAGTLRRVVRAIEAAHGIKENT